MLEIAILGSSQEYDDAKQAAGDPSRVDTPRGPKTTSVEGDGI